MFDLRKKTIKKWLLLCSATGFWSSIAAEPPSDYYDSINTSSPQALHQSLHTIIDDHQRFPYSSSAKDTWDILEIADQDPNNSNYVLDIYKNSSYLKQGGGNNLYNREHAWPKSYGFPNNVDGNYPYTDAHHLFISNISYNSFRGNKPFDSCDSGCIERGTDFNNNRGGTTNQANFSQGSSVQGQWEVWAGRRGELARAMMYMSVRYEGGTHGVTGYEEPDLRLTDERGLIEQSATGTNLSIAYMGLKSVLLQWHKEDPVDELERRRNDIVFSHQGNRNPFIDHPEYAACVFESDCSALNDSGDSNGKPWINEIHYDNQGSDRDEFVEIAGPAGTDLSGWKLLGYNGSNGSVYKTLSLSGVLNNQNNGFGTRRFAFTGMQNGAPDGLALVNESNSLVQFISYEGTFVAAAGAAVGRRSQDVGVSESSWTRTGHSLQLAGNGSEYAQFTWRSAAANTAGNVNHDQFFGDVDSNPISPVARFSYTCVDFNCEFDAQASTSSDGEIIQYIWDFGEGTTATGMRASHRFLSDGNYNVTLEVVTINDGVDTTTQQVTINAELPPASDCPVGYTKYLNSLASSGDNKVEPNGSYYYEPNSGVHYGELKGPNSSDFDLRLYFWNGRWSQVASSTASGSQEEVSFRGSEGYYYWKVESYTGAGDYTFCLKRP